MNVFYFIFRMVVILMTCRTSTTVQTCKLLSVKNRRASPWSRWWSWRRCRRRTWKFLRKKSPRWTDVAERRSSSHRRHSLGSGLRRSKCMFTTSKISRLRVNFNNQLVQGSNIGNIAEKALIAEILPHILSYNSRWNWPQLPDNLMRFFNYNTLFFLYYRSVTFLSFILFPQLHFTVLDKFLLLCFSVNLDIFVHHGQSKSLIALELQEKDIVLTTYGTLMAEFKEENHGPLLRAKWLRVVLDEGHQVKFFPLIFMYVVFWPSFESLFSVKIKVLKSYKSIPSRSRIIAQKHSRQLLIWTPSESGLFQVIAILSSQNKNRLDYIH